MPSSTSSSKLAPEVSAARPSAGPSVRQELRVMAVVVCVLLAAEVGMRLVEERFSQEYLRISTFPSRAARLAAAEAEPRVLIVGNSLVNDGLNLDVFNSQILDLRAVAEVDLFALPGSEMCEWYWLFKSHFIDRSQRPDILMISAAAFGDFPDVSISRLAAISHPDLYAEILQTDLRTFEQRAQFAHSVLSRSFAGRERVQKSMLDAIVPHYQAGRIWQQKMLRRAADVPPASPTDSAANGHDYTRLVRLLELADEQDVRVILVLMPMGDYYELDEQLQQVIAERGVGVIDCRRPDFLTPQSYYDGVHLTADAAAVFSRYLARRFAGEVLMPAGEPDVIEVVQ
jgi:hypothetical protein